MQASDLDRDARGRLRTLSRENADGVARHLVMAGRLLDTDPELAYEHAQAAVRRAGRVDVVREAAGLCAYATGRYGEALRELRTVRRLNGSNEHVAVMVDCERGLGRPDRALALAAEVDERALPWETRVELAVVLSGARLDLEQPDAAIAVLDTVPLDRGAEPWLTRIHMARAAALVVAGRSEEADREIAQAEPGLVAELSGDAGAEDVLVVDLESDAAPQDGDGAR